MVDQPEKPSEILAAPNVQFAAGILHDVAPAPGSLYANQQRHAWPAVLDPDKVGLKRIRDQIGNIRMDNLTTQASSLGRGV